MPWNNACTRPQLLVGLVKFETIQEEHISVLLQTLSFPKDGSMVHCYKHTWYVLPSCIMKTELDTVRFTMEPPEREEWPFVLVKSWATWVNSLLQHFCTGDSSHGAVNHPLGPSHHFNWCSPSVHFWNSRGKMGQHLTYFNKAETQIQSLKYI